MTASSISSFGLSQCAVMQARSALFDLYGDYLRSRGGRAPVAALVRLLAPLGIAAPAVRTAVSRMVRQGWLHPMRLGSGPGYLLTPKAARRLDEAAARIYRTGRAGWDGRFDLIVLHAAAARPGGGPAGLPRVRPLERERLGGAARGRRGRRGAGRGRRDRTSGSAPATRPVRRAPPRWSAGPGTWTSSAAAYESFVDRTAAGGDRGQRAQQRRGGVRGPVPARPRLAHVPVPRPAAARRPAPGPLAGHRARPDSSTGTRPGCGRPPTGTSNAACTRRDPSRTCGILGDS